MSRLRDKRTRHDRYYRRARKESYAARSVYKLQEIDRRFSLFKKGNRVLDLGCRPGSWMQFACERVGPRGFVVGLDRQQLEITIPQNGVALVGDVLELDPATLREALPAERAGCFQLVLSDMAPDTIGVSFADQVRSVELFSRALDLAQQLGCPGSRFVGKLFMGDGFDETLALVRQRYGKTKTVRPDATRKSSREVYIVGQGLKPHNA